MIGQVISHYKILEKLGEGGMGVVYKAHDTRLDRDVALKFLPASLHSSSEELKRFEQEAKAISALNHANIATIHDIDEYEGQKFLVLEFIPGGTLKTKVKNAIAEGNELPMREVIDYGIQIAEGLAHAHRHQIIHRDVKSDNVMLTEEGKVKITDFGLAKLRGTTHITKTGSTIGTAAYMSPEQFRGEDVDQRADIFSYGVVLYELTALHMPFRGEHEAALAYSITNESPTLLGSLRPNLPEGLEQVIFRCLEKDKTKRYQSADEIAADLRKIQQEITGSVRTIVKQSRMPWLIAAALMIIVATGLYLFMRSSRPIGANSKTIAVLPFENMSDNKDDEYFSDGMMEDILTQLSKIADLNVISRTSVMQYKNTRKTVKEIGIELNAGFVLEGSVRHAGDQVRIVAQLIDATTDKHIWAETYDKEIKQIFAVQSDVAQKIASELRAKLTPVEKERIEKKPTENLDAYSYYLQARDHANKDTKDMEIAMELDRKALQLDTNFALAYADLGAECAISYQWVHRKSLIDSALSLGKKALSIDPNIAQGYNAMGMVYDILGDQDKAIENYQKAIGLNPNYYAPVGNLGNIYYERGDQIMAIQLYKKSIILDPLSISFYANIALAYCDLGEFENAGSYGNKSIERGDRSWRPIATLAKILIEEGKQQEAISFADSQLSLYPDEILNYSTAGGVHLFVGDLQKAKIYFEKIVRKDSASFTSWVPANNTTYLGYILQKLGEIDKAQRLFANSAKRSAQDLKDAPNDPSIPYDLGALEAIGGNKPEAYKWLQQTVDKGFREYRLIQLDPLFENLRSDRQFAQMMDRMKSKQDEMRKQLETEDVH